MLPGFEVGRAAVANAVARAGATMLRLEEALPDSEWQSWLLEAVARATVAIADVTDHNAFVMYELGLVHARQLPTILIVDARNDRVPATILGSPFLPYDWQDMSSFQNRLTDYVSDERGQIASRLENAHWVSEQLSTGWYKQALSLLSQFCADTYAVVTPVTLQEFSLRLSISHARGQSLPDSGDFGRLAHHLLSYIVEAADNVATMRLIVDWAAGLTTSVQQRAGLFQARLREHRTRAAFP
jgi:hypothetical protein